MNPKDWKDKYKGDHGGLASTSYGDEWGYVPSTVKDLWWNLNENDNVQKEWVFRPTWELNYHILDWLTAKVDGNINYYTLNQEYKQLGSDPAHPRCGPEREQAARRLQPWRFRAYGILQQDRAEQLRRH